MQRTQRVMLYAAPPPAPPAPPPYSEPTPDSQADLFSTLLDADAAVDEVKLRRAACAGIPIHVRPLVWRLLLGITALNSIHGVASEQERTRGYDQLAAEVDEDNDVARRIRAVLKRSRSAYQPLGTHEKRAGRQGSTSGESFDGDEDEEHGRTVQEQPMENSHGSENGRAVSYVRSSRHAKVRIVDREVLGRFTRVINTFLQSTTTSVEFHPDMVHLSAPFIELMPTESDAFYGFNALMQRYNMFFHDEDLQEAVSDFITMFRSLHQDLYDQFIAEEVDMNKWVPKWLRSLLVHQLPRRALLRLWDSYFANPRQDGLDLHPYVCLVFVEHIKPDLQDCDDGERILTLLNKLPNVNIDHIIAHALTVREQIREGGIL